MTFKQPVTTKGDLIVKGTQQVERLPRGNDAEVLVADGDEALGLKYTGRFDAITTETSDYQVDLDDSVILADATGGQVTVTLPPVNFALGRKYWIKRLNAGANAVIVAGQ